MAAFCIKCISGVLLLHIIHTYAHTDTWKLTVYKESRGAALLQVKPSDRVSDVERMIQLKTGETNFILVHKREMLYNEDALISSVPGLRDGSVLWWVRKMKVGVVLHIDEVLAMDQWLVTWRDVTVGDFKRYVEKVANMQEHKVLEVYHKGKKLIDDSQMLRECGVKLMEVKSPLDLTDSKPDGQLQIYLKPESVSGQPHNPAQTHTDMWQLTVHRESGGAPLILVVKSSDTVYDLKRMIVDITGDDLLLHLLIQYEDKLHGHDVPISTLAGLRTGSELWWVRMMKVHVVYHINDQWETASWVPVWRDATVGYLRSIFQLRDDPMPDCNITSAVYYMVEELVDDGAMLKECGVKFIETNNPQDMPSPRRDQQLHVYSKFECVNKDTPTQEHTQTDMWQLTVHRESGDTSPLSLEVNPSDKVSELLRMVTEITGDKMLDHLLIYNGNLLRDHDIPISAVSGLSDGSVLWWARKMAVNVVLHVGEVEKMDQWWNAWRDMTVGYIKRTLQNVREMSGYKTTLVAHHRGKELVDDEAQLRECGVKLFEMRSHTNLPNQRPDQQLHMYLGFEFSDGQTSTHTDMWQLVVHRDSEATSQVLTVKPEATVFDLHVMMTEKTGDKMNHYVLLHNENILLDHRVPITSLPGLRTGSELWWTRRLDVNVVLHVGEAEEKADWWATWRDVTVGYIKKKQELMLINTLGYNTTLVVHYKGKELVDDSAKLRECGVKLLEWNEHENRPDLKPEQQLHIYSVLEFVSGHTNTQARTHTDMWQLIVHRESGAASLSLGVKPSDTIVELQRRISAKTGDDLSLHLLVHNEEILSGHGVPIFSVSGLGTGSELWWMRKMAVWPALHVGHQLEMGDWWIVLRDVTVGYFRRNFQEMNDIAGLNSELAIRYMGKELIDDEATLRECGVKLLVPNNLEDLPDPRPDQQIHVYLRKKLESPFTKSIKSILDATRDNHQTVDEKHEQVDGPSV